MNSGRLTFQDVLQLVELVKNSASFSELRLRCGDLELELRRGRPGVAPVGGEVTSPLASDLGRAATEPSPPPTEAMAGDAHTARPPVEARAATAAKAETSPEAGSGSLVVRAPMVGTIYRSPEPGVPPFVQVGQRVAAGEQLCIIEVMKLMNAVAAEGAGTVVEILVSDGEVVEFGQALFVVAPH